MMMADEHVRSRDNNYCGNEWNERAQPTVASSSDSTIVDSNDSGSLHATERVTYMDQVASLARVINDVHKDGATVTTYHLDANESSEEIVTLASDNMIGVAVEHVVAAEEVTTENVNENEDKMSCVHYGDAYDKDGKRIVEIEVDDCYNSSGINKQSTGLLKNTSNSHRKRKRHKKETTIVSVVDKHGNIQTNSELEDKSVLMHQYIEKHQNRFKVVNRARSPHVAMEMKKQRDRETKRLLRMDPVYRQLERERSREIMQSKRSNPMYRAVEREKDKERRRQARQKPEFREIEKLRDKLAKKKSRRKLISKSKE